MNYSDIEYLSLPLPEDILKEKWSGNFDRARKLIKIYMDNEDTTYALKCRLEFELNNLNGMEHSYTVSREDALEQIRSRIPDFSEEEFEHFHDENKMDWIYLNGEVKYIDSFCNTLFKVYPEMWIRQEGGDKSDYKVLDDLIYGLKDGQHISSHIHIKQELSIDEMAFEEGENIYVHMPIPQNRDGVQSLNIIEMSHKPVFISDESSFQSVVYFEEKAQKGQVFSLEYELENVKQYIDLSKVSLSEEEYGNISEEAKQYLCEQLPHIQFTPLMRSLAKEIAGDNKNPLDIARAIYNYITSKVDYRFVRSYANIDNLAEYCAINRRGDCGVMVLLFVTLCRLNGIPAKWESGIDAKPGDVGEHDWAKFYVPTKGWVYADLSYGAGAYIRGAYDRWNFFFGNVDPYRIPFNCEFQKDLEPAKKFSRIDPYDNQCGEVEFDNRGLSEYQLIYRYIEIDIHRIE